jgi:hypothetical protein
MSPALYLYRPCGELTQDDVIYRAPEGACLPGSAHNPGTLS